MGQPRKHHTNVDFGNTEQVGGIPGMCAATDDGVPHVDPTLAHAANSASVSSFIEPSRGPVFLEGRLILSLSFQDCGAMQDLEQPGEKSAIAEGHTPVRALDLPEVLEPLERYEIWDELTGVRYKHCSIELVRFEEIDVVMHGEGDALRTWVGQLDVSKRIILVPDLDEQGFKANQSHDLYWKRVWSAFSSTRKLA